MSVSVSQVPTQGSRPLRDHLLSCVIPDLPLHTVTHLHPVPDAVAPRGPACLSEAVIAATGRTTLFMRRLPSVQLSPSLRDPEAHYRPPESPSL